MYKRLLIAADGSSESDNAPMHGFALAKALAAKVTVVRATEPWTEAAFATLPTPSMVRVYDEVAAGTAATILDNAKAEAEQAGVSCATRHIRDAHAPEAIIKAAKEEGCDLSVHVDAVPPAAFCSAVPR